MSRVLIYALNYSPEPLGVGRYTGDIGGYLVEQGHQVRVVTAVPHYPAWKVAEGYRNLRYSSEDCSGAWVTRCPLLLWRPMRGIWRLLAPLTFSLTSFPILMWAMLRFQPDVVFCVEPSLFAAPAALLLSKIAGSRTILHVQDLEVDAAFAVGHLKGGLAQRCAAFLEKAVLSRFDQIITISERMRTAIGEKGVPQNQIALVRNWVDLDVIRPLTGRNRYREEFGWADSDVIALYAGSIGAKQALHVVLDAAEQLKNRSGIRFVIAGDGPTKSELIRQYGHLNNVVFVPPQPETRMCDLLNLADIHLLPQTRGIADLVLPSKLGGMLASGKPVLVTADAGTELFEALSGTAIIVPAGDSDALARELVFFSNQSRRHPQIGDGRKLVAEMSRVSCLRKIASYMPPVFDVTEDKPTRLSSVS